MLTVSDIIERIKAATETGAKYPRYIVTNVFKPAPAHRDGSKHIGGRCLPRSAKRKQQFRQRRKVEKLARRAQRK